MSRNLKQTLKTAVLRWADQEEVLLEGRNHTIHEIVWIFPHKGLQGTAAEMLVTSTMVSKYRAALNSPDFIFRSDDGWTKMS